MSRKTITALIAFVTLGVLAFVALRQPDKGERASDHPRPLARLVPADITTLEVTKNGATTVIKNDGGKYRVTAPVDYPADDGVAKAAFDGLGKMEVSDLVTEQKAKQAEFEVDDKTGVRVVAKHGAAVLADLLIGKTGAGGTMVRLTGKDEIWQASGISRYTFDKSPSDWRDKSVVAFTPADAERVELAAKDGSKAVVKKTGTKQGNEDKWAVVTSSLKIDKLDDSVPNGIVSAMSVLKANEFADAAKPADVGLAPPALTVTVVTKGDKRTTVLVGNKKGADDVYVKAADKPQIFLVKKYTAERFAKRPIELRDKTLCNVADADIAEISVVHGDASFTLARSGADWKASKPAKLDVDASKVTPIAAAFKDWKGNGFAEDQSLKDNGLAKPTAVVTVKAKGKSSVPACQLHIGDLTGDKLSYFVASTNKADVYTAAKWSVDRVLVKPDDLKKKPGTSVAKK